MHPHHAPLRIRELWVFCSSAPSSGQGGAGVTKSATIGITEEVGGEQRVLMTGMNALVQLPILMRKRDMARSHMSAFWRAHAHVRSLCSLCLSLSLSVSPYILVRTRVCLRSLFSLFLSFPLSACSQGCARSVHTRVCTMGVHALSSPFILSV